MKKLYGLLILGLLTFCAPSSTSAQEVYTYIHPQTGVRTKCRMDYYTQRCITLTPEYSDGYNSDRRGSREARDDYDNDGYQNRRRHQKRYLDRVYDPERNEEYYSERRNRVRQRIDYGVNTGYYNRGITFRHTIWVDGERLDIVSSSKDFRPQIYRDSGGFYYYDY